MVVMAVLSVPFRAATAHDDIICSLGTPGSLLGKQCIACVDLICMLLAVI